MIIYFLSGLGADKRMFKKLDLPAELEIKHIEWIAPLPSETLPAYAKRLSAQMNTSVPFQLVGLSFGGIVATELSKLYQPLGVILISSVSVSAQVPWYYKLAGRLRLYALLPVVLLRKANFFTYWIFGARSGEQKELLKQVLADTDAVFLKWAITKITTWKNKTKAKNVFHIHGTDDKLLPIRYIDADVEIKDGGHLMVYDKHQQLSELLTTRIKACIK